MSGTVVSLLASALLLGADPAPKPAAGKGPLDGKWKVVALVSEGEVAPAEEIEDTRLIFLGRRYFIECSTVCYVGKLHLDPSRSPPVIDLAFIADRKPRTHGIYRLEGDRLTICWAEGDAPRPTSFASPRGTGLRMLTLERVKKR
jgi:uncharacterized protein (TIGR03067 family)